MTTPTEVSTVSNGTQQTQKSELQAKPTPASQQKATNGIKVKVNGQPSSEHVSPIMDIDTTPPAAPAAKNHLKSSTPPPPASVDDTLGQPLSSDDNTLTESGASIDEDIDGSPEQLKRDLYVGNLHPRVMPHMLKDLFGGDTMVENVKIVPDRNLSHGGLAYGFVTMVSRAAAEEYMTKLQNFAFFGLEFRINWATPTKSAERGLSLFVGDIGPDVSVDDLRNAFQDESNSVTDARIVMDPNSGRTKGYGFVTFKDTQSAERALTKNGEILKGRKMRVNWAATTSKDSKTPAVQPTHMATTDMYVPSLQGIQPFGRPNEVQMQLNSMAQIEGLDVSWWMRLSPEIQTGIVRVSNEAPGAKVVWIGNLEKGTTQHEIAPFFSPYGIVEEITMVSANGYAFISMASHLTAATLIVIFKDFTIRGRKIKTGWSHSTQRQLQKQLQTPLTGQIVPPRPQPGMPMQPPMPPMAPMTGPTYIYPQQPMMYNPYATPPTASTYPMVPHGTSGTSTPHSTASAGSATPASQSNQTNTAKESNAPASR